MIVGTDVRPNRANSLLSSSSDTRSKSGSTTTHTRPVPLLSTSRCHNSSVSRRDTCSLGGRGALLVPQCIAELTVHRDCVNDILPLPAGNFVTCASDKVWKCCVV